MKIPIRIKIFILLLIISFITNTSFFMISGWLSIPFLIALLFMLLFDEKKERINIKKHSLIILSIVGTIIYFLGNLNNNNVIIECILVFLVYLFYIYDIPSKKCNLDCLYIKNIVIENVNNDITNYLIKLKNSGIKLVLITNKKYKYIKKIDDLEENDLNKNISITKKEYNNKKDLFNDEDIMIIKDDSMLNKAINNIIISRGDYDNLVRANKLKIIFIMSMIISNIILYISGYPTTMNLNMLIVLYVYYHILIQYVIPYFRYDTDIMDRKVRIRNDKIFNIEEKILLIVSSISIVIGSSLTYMYIITEGGLLNLANSLYILSFLYCYLFTMIYYIAEKTIIKIIINNIIHWTFISIIIITILYSLLVLDKAALNTSKVVNSNYILVIIISFIVVVWQDIIKFARSMSVRRNN